MDKTIYIIDTDFQFKFILNHYKNNKIYDKIRLYKNIFYDWYGNVKNLRNNTENKKVCLYINLNNNVCTFYIEKNYKDVIYKIKNHHDKFDEIIVIYVKDLILKEKIKNIREW